MYINRTGQMIYNMLGTRCAKKSDYGCDAVGVISGEKRKLRDSFNQQRKIFDKLNRSAKWKNQMAERDRLNHPFSDHDTRNFCRYIGKIGLQNNRKSRIPMEVVDDDGNITTNIDDVLLRWKNDYENFFRDNNDNVWWKSSPECKTTHFETIYGTTKRCRFICVKYLSALNADITREEVEKSIVRAKLCKAAGLDNIPAVVLRNPVCFTNCIK